MELETKGIDPQDELEIDSPELEIEEVAGEETDTSDDENEDFPDDEDDSSEAEDDDEDEEPVKKVRKPRQPKAPKKEKEPEETIKRIAKVGQIFKTKNFSIEVIGEENNEYICKVLGSKSPRLKSGEIFSAMPVAFYSDFYTLVK